MISRKLLSVRGLIVVFILFTVSGCGSNPFNNSDLWIGEYVCGQGKTNLELRIVEVNDDIVKAIFAFNHVPSGKSGSFNMIGQYEKEGKKIKFEPLDWISQPKGYRTVGMEGWILDDPVRFEGKINSPGCTSFSVKPAK